MLSIIDRLPEGFLDIEAQHLHAILDGPTLIHLPGRQPEPLFVSILLHGNEITGLLAVQQLLKHYGTRQLPRSLSLFVGNIYAAQAQVRRLNTQHDYNRIWQGGDSPEHAMAQQVLDEMARLDPFASIDIHNNTGLNPHYGCINDLAPPFLQLANLFGRTTVYFTQPNTVQSAAFAKLCPAMVVECGQPGQAYGTEHAYELLQACLHLTHFSDRPINPKDIDLFHTVATVKIPTHLQFSIGNCASSDVCFPEDLDRWNFSELPTNSLLATYPPNTAVRLQVTDDRDLDVGNRYFHYANGEIRTQLPVMPSMLTLDERIVRQDCLCYLMERYPLACDIGSGRTAELAMSAQPKTVLERS